MNLKKIRVAFLVSNYIAPSLKIDVAGIIYSKQVHIRNQRIHISM